MISNDKYKAIAELNFSSIKRKLTHPTHGEGWSVAKADAMETEYRRFLYLQVAFPDEQTAPSLDVDVFWHYHILDTAKYADDCEQAFGFFLHHYPYVGLLEGDEPGMEIKAGERTRELYEACFGEAYIRAEAYGEADLAATAEAGAGMNSARCQGACVRLNNSQASIDASAAGGTTAARCQGACVRFSKGLSAGSPGATTGFISARCQGACVRFISTGRPNDAVQLGASAFITAAPLTLSGPAAVSHRRSVALQAT
ncbi:MAG: glycine-rich domain-containing protein-like [Pseudomonadota bacterium]